MSPQSNSYKLFLHISLCFMFGFIVVNSIFFISDYGTANDLFLSPLVALIVSSFMILYVYINHLKSDILPKTKQNFSIFVFVLCGCGFIILLGEFISWGFGEDGDIIRSIVMLYLLTLMAVIFKKHISPLSNAPTAEANIPLELSTLQQQNAKLRKLCDTLYEQNNRLSRVNREHQQDDAKLKDQIKELQEQIKSLKQQTSDYRQQIDLFEKREVDITEREEKQVLWMESFEGGDGAIEKTTQSVVNLFHDIQNEIDPLLSNIRILNDSFYMPSYELKKHLTNAQTVIQEQKHLLLSFTQTLASYLHHFAQRAQDLREREEKADHLEAELLENSPYIVEKAFNNIFIRTGNAFYHAQALALNRYYERVKDKRFERAMIDGIHYTTGPAVICRIKSNEKSHPNPYVTSLSTCTCQDFRRHKQPCKHMLFLAYHTGYLFLNKEKLESSMKQHVEELKKN
ncbi:MAG: hypothetical protein E7645_08330 [Ruminococcaceae bacterium]|nr:hypothetical protein [Oscillospiraceae bacterium]